MDSSKHSRAPRRQAAKNRKGKEVEIEKGTDQRGDHFTMLFLLPSMFPLRLGVFARVTFPGVLKVAPIFQFISKIFLRVFLFGMRVYQQTARFQRCEKNRPVFIGQNTNPSLSFRVDKGRIGNPTYKKVISGILAVTFCLRFVVGG